MGILRSRRGVVLLVIAMCLQVTGCAIGSATWQDQRRLNETAQSLHRSGTISVSAPILVKVGEGTDFAFALNKDATFYYEAQRVETAIQLVREQALDFQLAGRAQLEELAGALEQIQAAKSAEDMEAARRKLTMVALSLASINKAAAGNEGLSQIMGSQPLQAGLAFLTEMVPDLQELTGGLVAEEPGEEGAEDAPATTAAEATAAPEDDSVPDAEKEAAEFTSALPITTRTAMDTLSSKTFSTPLPRYAESLVISPSEALRLAATDKMTQEVLNWFGHPEGFGKNKKAFFCVFTVSCQPGYKTRKRFMADVMVMTEYAKKVPSENLNLDLVKTLHEGVRATTACIESVKRQECARERLIALSDIVAELASMHETLNKQAEIDAKTNEEIKAALATLRGQASQAKSLAEALPDGEPDTTKRKQDLIAQLTVLETAPESGTQPVDRQTNAGSGMRSTDAGSGGGRFIYASQHGGGNLDNFPRPLVAAVYPLMHGQVMDLRSSLRQQLSVATQLAAMGYGSQAEALLDAVRRVERDAQSRTVVPVGTAYSANGYNFGFRVEPRFAAMGNPRSWRSRPGQRLESVQFPAMVVLFADNDDLKEWDHVAFHVEPRWVPTGWWTILRRWTLWGLRPEKKILKRAYRLDKLGARIKSLKRDGKEAGQVEVREKAGPLVLATMQRRRAMLSAAGLGSTITMALPDYDKPDPVLACIADPDRKMRGWTNIASAFVVEGENLHKAQIKGAIIGGRDCAVNVVGPRAAVVVCDAWDLHENEKPAESTTEKSDGAGCASKSRHDLYLLTPKGPLKAGEVIFDLTARAPKENPSVTITRDKSGEIEGVSVSGKYSSAKGLLDAIREALDDDDENAIDLKVSGGKIELDKKD